MKKIDRNNYCVAYNFIKSDNFSTEKRTSPNQWYLPTHINIVSIHKIFTLASKFYIIYIRRQYPKKIFLYQNLDIKNVLLASQLNYMSPRRIIIKKISRVNATFAKNEMVTTKNPGRSTGKIISVEMMWFIQQTYKSKICNYNVFETYNLTFGEGTIKLQQRL